MDRTIFYGIHRAWRIGLEVSPETLDPQCRHKRKKEIPQHPQTESEPLYIPPVDQDREILQRLPMTQRRKGRQKISKMHSRWNAQPRLRMRSRPKPHETTA